MPAAGPKYGLTPALPTMTSIAPQCAMVPSTSACNCSLCATWHGMAMASPPLSRIPLATVSHTSPLRLEITTLAPCSAMRSAMARPIPFVDPVTTATFPVRSNSDDMSLPLAALLALLPPSMVGAEETSIGPAMPARENAVYRHADLARLLNPASVAVVGASTRAGSFGERVLKNLDTFHGRYYAVNARYDRIGTLPCYPNVAALPEVPDCAVIATPREAVEEIARDCASAGVGGAIVFASGYAEVGKQGRIAEQERLAEIARSTGLRIVGPNCIGIVNTALRAELTFMSITPIPPPRPNSIGLISQSGALGMTLAQACVRGVSFSHVMTSGNSCDVDMADYIGFLIEEPNCRAIACVFEGMADPRRLLLAAEMAWQADKPLIVFKMATGEQGAAAAMSHTGTLAGSEAAYRAAFRRAGAIIVDDYESLIETAAFFAKAAPMKARGVAVLATSGGAAIMAADRAEQHGVPL